MVDLKRLYAMVPVIGALFLSGLLPAYPVGAAPQPLPTKVSDDVPTPVTSGHVSHITHLAPRSQVAFTVALAPPHQAEEEAFLRELQNPRSSEFHRYLTPAQWNARFAPTVQSQNAVVTWLKSQGLTVTHVWPNRLLIDAAGSSGEVGRAFGVIMNSYRTPSLRAQFYSNDRNPTLPGALSNIVQNVVLNNYAPIHPQSGGARAKQARAQPLSMSTTGSSVSPMSGQGDGTRRVLATVIGRAGSRQSAGHARPFLTSGSIDPRNLWSSYGYSVGALYAQGHCCNPFHNPTTGTPTDTSIAIATACPFLNSDLAGFTNQFGLAFHWQGWNVDGGPGANNNCANANDGGRFETSMDVEDATAMSNSFGCYCDTSTVNVFWAPASGVDSGGSPRLAFSSFFDLWNAVITANNSRVMSMSWGAAENSWGPTNMQTGHNVLNNAAGIGITTIIAAGDSGAFENGNANAAEPSYPSSDTDVVAAGGTQTSFNTDGSYASETTWNSGGGGCSTYFDAPGYQTTGGFDNGCSGKRAEPDVSLNASNITNQALFFDGSWFHVWGTSEVAPELAGLFAQFNAYLLAEGSICGLTGTAPCEPIGLPTPIIWHQGIEQNYSPHRPFYDITTGNNDNGTGTGTYSAKAGYDLATGWGSLNALQLYRLFAWYLTPDYHSPIVSFTGPQLGHWYNFNYPISVSITDPKQGSDPSTSGVGGYSWAWDQFPGDPITEPTPGCCNSYWNGPEFPNATSGTVDLASAGQGCHSLNVQAWDNLGRSTFNDYGALCYDSINPLITHHSFAPPSPAHPSTVTIKSSAADPGCGTTGSCVNHIEYWVNSAADGTTNGQWFRVGSSSGPSGSATWKTNQEINNGFARATWDAGTHYVATIPWDNAGNAEACAPPTQTNTCLTFRLTRPDWPQYRQNARHTGFNPFETSITTQNAGGLKRRCSFANSGIVSPASVYDQVAYVGSTDGKVYAIDSHCKQKWAFKTGGPVVSTPDVTDDVVYVGSSDGSIYALRMSTGALLWRTHTGGKVQSSPVLSNGVVYVGSSDHRLYALNFTNGSVLWSYLTGGSITSSPAVDQSVVFVGSGDGKVYAMTVAGALKWSFRTGGAVKSSTAIRGGRVFVGSEDKRLYALDELTGKKIWSFATGGKIDSSPAVSGRLVFVGSADKNLYAVGAQAGHKVWAASTGRSITSDPAAANGVLFTGTHGNFVLNRMSDGKRLFSDPTGDSAVSDGSSAVYVSAKKLILFAP